MKMEFTEFQKEAMKIVDLLRLHQEELENCLQEIFPNVVIKIIARGVPVYNQGSKEDTFIYNTSEQDGESGKEFLITSSGANDLEQEWYNDRLFITFINMSKSKN